MMGISYTLYTTDVAIALIKRVKNWLTLWVEKGGLGWCFLLDVCLLSACRFGSSGRDELCYSMSSLYYVPSSVPQSRTSRCPGISPLPAPPTLPQLPAMILSYQARLMSTVYTFSYWGSFSSLQQNDRVKNTSHLYACVGWSSVKSTEEPNNPLWKEDWCR